MGILDSIKTLFKPEQLEHEAVDLKTGRTITLVKVRQPDGSYVIKRASGQKTEEHPPHEFTIEAEPAEKPQAVQPRPREEKPHKLSFEPAHLPGRQRSSKLEQIKSEMYGLAATVAREEAPVKKEITVREAAQPQEKKLDILELLENDIDRAIKIKDERDLLLEKLREFEGRLGELDVHKSARKDAEHKLASLEDSVAKLGDEKTGLEEEIVKLRAERDEIRDKIKSYERVFGAIKEKVVRFDQKI